MSAIIRPAVILFAFLTVLTGIVYPLVVTAIAEVAFPYPAQGSVIVRNGKLVGSELIGQSFSDPKYFWSRPSATSPQPYNGTGSTGSNLGPLNPALIDAVKARIQALKAADPNNKAPIPVDLVTASASGLDPHVSVAAAQYQINRIARARGLRVGAIQALVAAYTEGRLLGVLGEARVNVLELNLALDALSARSAALPAQ
ncbi:MAG TPA: potassium-transporting ATPase subunit KdpC [Steroidobacteraceae bacterium]|jgi:K+-transporting ATPase ATPase C chain|nr:potassium-transporting ATPase subunit KdpC [Steroidobacteraceae bacterium]